MKKTFYNVLCLAAIIVVYACATDDHKPNIKPTVTTASAVKVNDSVYTCGGNVTAQGSSAVTERGVVISLETAPAIDDVNDKKIPISSGTGNFATDIGPFSGGFTYFIRAYAINTQGVAYGNEISVTVTSTTPTSTKPTVTTTSAIKVNDSTYTCGGNVTAQGSSAVTENGVVISLDPAPTIDDANDIKTSISSGTGTFAANIGPFPGGHKYYIRAYAINSKGVAYGDDVTITVDPRGGTNSNGGCTVVEVNADINVVTTWTAGNVYVVKSWINVNAPLTIEPGVIVKFLNANCGIEIYAKTTADGTADKPIIFTSYKDDAYCGDTNGDGTATTGSKGDWGRLTMRGDQHGSLFRYCKFLYGGGSNSNVIKVDASGSVNDFTFDHCTFAHTYGTNSYTTAAFNGGNMNDESVSIVTNNIFYDNAIPVYIPSYYGLDASNSYHNPDNTSETNKYNGIFVYGGGMNGRSVVYGETEVPYVFNVGGNATLSVGSADFLKIEANVILKFGQSSAGVDLGDYPNNANIASSVIFTSYRDDARGGDTNGDGSTSSPATGDWNGYGYWTAGHGSYVWVHTNVFYAAK
ncbi:MAG: hypothetical protein JST48_01395 [Bacteroidetes bacterium]|nr:hypothetical protein [Bacteroidota bacterium]